MRNPKKRWLNILVCLLLVSGLMITGCSDAPSNSETISSANTTDNEQISFPIEIKGEDAPITAGNFVDLVERGFYDGLIFHRVVTDPKPFVAQGGDPKGNGTGGFIDPDTQQERRIPLEIKLKGDETPTYSKALGQQGSGTVASQPVVLKHERGAVAMARSGMPDSASSQFYFALSDLEFLNGDYAVFGKVTQGMDVVDAIKQGDRIDSAKVVSGLENLKKE